jgi:hypothetical protein
VSGASVEVNTCIMFVSLNPNVCMFFFIYVVFAEILIKIVHLYTIQLFVSKLPCGMIRRATGNGYQNTQIMIFKREYLIVVCL